MHIAEGLVHAAEGVQQRMPVRFGEADPDYAVRVQKAWPVLADKLCRG